MKDLIIRNCTLTDGQKGVDIAVLNGKIEKIAPAIEAQAKDAIDAKGNLVSAPFIDPHFHLDATLSYGLPRVNQSGTLLEGIALWGELKPHLTIEALKTRAHKLLKWSIAKGTLAIRTHVDVSDDRLLAVEALLEVREEIAPYIDLQLVAFPQDGFYRSPTAEANLIRALDMGVDVVGGIPHFERTMSEGARSVARLCEIAAERGLMVDMHCDESDDPHSRHIETLALETLRHNLQGRVAGSHLTSMHSMDNYYVSKLLPLIKEAEITAIPNPLINITLQGRHDSYPKRRGMTRVEEMMAQGINVAFGHDCVMDPWYSLGSHDMLEVAHMALHVAMMTGQNQMKSIFEGVTNNSAKVMHLEGYGIKEGNKADMVILQASDQIEAMRLRAQRLYVLKAGKVIAKAPEATSEVFINDEAHKVDFRHQPS